ncbi:MAG: phenylacetate--CoA ligase family protein [Gaiellales bacterium]
MSISPYFSAIDWDRLEREFPVGQAFLDRYVGMPRERLEQDQERRLDEVLDVAWATPLYRRLWSAQGIDRRDIRGLADLQLLPVIDKTTILADAEEHPPLGSLSTRTDRPRGPIVLQTTSGTTGAPQPVIWGAWGREVQNALAGRIYRWVGMTGDDVAMSVYGHGLLNGGHFIREAVVRYTDTLLLPVGTGKETRSERQVDLMARFGVTVLLGFTDYLRRLGDLAIEMGHQPGVDIPVRLIVGQLLDPQREPLESLWGGAKAYNWYGVADTGGIASEGPERDGLHVFEDANVLEVLDEAGEPVSPGGKGEIVVTSLGKSDVAPLVRFNTHDLTRVLPEPNPTGLPFRRIEGHLGRGDNMVKLKGVNVYPSAIGNMLADAPGFTGEYVCRLENGAYGDRLVVIFESDKVQTVSLADVKSSLATHLGVGVDAEVVAPGATASLTGVYERQKPTRLIDARG